MSGTQALAVRKAVIDAVAALPAFSAVECAVSWNAASEAAERVYTRDSVFDQKPASLRAGRTFRDEAGTFVVVVRVEGIDKAQAATSQRAIDLGVLIEEWVADNRSLAGVNSLRAEGRGQLVEAYNDLGTLALLSYTIAYSARLT